MGCCAVVLEQHDAAASVQAAAQVEDSADDAFVTVAVAAAGDVAAVAEAGVAAAAADVDWTFGDCSDAGKLDLVEHATAVPTTVKSVVL